MRTTINLDQELLTEAKVLAQRTGKTLTAVIEEALRERLAAVLVPPVASSAQTGYSKPGGIIQTEIDNGGGNHNPGAVVESSSPGGVTETQSSGTTLPFTGLDVVLVAAAGGLLLALGLGMRRLARSSSVA